jgi:hypothetical protein
MLQLYIQDGRLNPEQQRILQNIQDCRNSLNAGRPMDILERETTDPTKSNCNGSCEEAEEEEDHTEEDAELFQATTTFISYGSPCFRDEMGRLKFTTSLSTSFGKHACGKKFLPAPSIRNGHNVPSVITANAQQSFFEVTQNISSVREVTSESLSILTSRRTERVLDKDLGRTVPLAIGTLTNIRDYAQILFAEDIDQQRAFECIVARFFLRIYTEAWKFDSQHTDLPERKKRRLNKEKEILEQVNRRTQLICFLSGAGGTGKSRVLTSCVIYAKKFCMNLNLRFDSRSIVVTALTGAAAVSLHGETLHSAAALQRKVTGSDIEEWKFSFMIFVDEISFASKNVIMKLHDKLRSLKEQPDLLFGGMDVVFSGDFSQLRPVIGKPLYLEKDFLLWDENVHTFLELRTNHRFRDDQSWGVRLARYRETGPESSDIECINTRVLGSPNGPKEHNIPPNAVYATKTNLDRMAINDGIFANHLKETHMTDASIPPPKHTICVKAGQLQWHKGKRNFENFNNASADVFYACVGEAQVCGSQTGKTHDPLLKLYYKRPVMITENIDVGNCIANGTLCEFYGVVLNDGVTELHFETIVIDGYFVRSINISHLKSIKLRLLDGLSHPDEEKFTYLEPVHVTGKVNFPIPLEGQVDKSTPRVPRGIRMVQFPIVAANARTIHKLQGRSLENIVISSWDYTDNWIYVALSRVKTMGGLFLRLPLDLVKCRGMSVEARQFMEKLGTKRPPNPVVIRY